LHSHAHHHHADEPPLDPPEAFQMLSWFLSDPTPEAADELRSYLQDIRNIAFYYRFLIDTAELSEGQLSLVRQFLSQTYAAQQLLHQYPAE
jgi:hypothetical protein